MYDHDILVHENTGFPPYYRKPWLIDLKSHCILIGKTGSGKSNYLRNILNQLETDDCNVVLLDPHVEVANYALMKSKKNKIFLSGRDYPGSEGIYTGTNVLKLSDNGEEAYLVADWVRSSLAREDAISQGVWGARLNFIFTSLLPEIMLAEKGLTLKDFRKLLSNGRVILSLLDPYEESGARDFLAGTASTSREWRDYISSSMNRLVPITSDKMIQRMISARDEDAFDLDSAVLGRNNLIVPDVDRGVMTELAQKAIVSLMITRIWNIIKKRGPSSERTYIIVDEAKLLSGAILEEILTEGRKYGIIVILAYQSLAQIPKESRQSVLASVSNFACFRMMNEDAAILSFEIEATDDVARKKLQFTLVKQKYTNVTIYCAPDTEEVERRGFHVYEYGPVTVSPPFVDTDYSLEEADLKKAEILKTIGKGRIIALSPEAERKKKHDHLIFMFSEFLKSHRISTTIEPSIGNLIPDILIEYNGKRIFCEVEDSDLLVTNRIAKKMKDYSGSPLIFLCRHEDFNSLISMIRNIMQKTRKGEYYTHLDEKIPASAIPASLLNLYIVTYSDRDFLYYNGSEHVRFMSSHLERAGSFIYRSRSLPLGVMRESVLKDISEMISQNGSVDLDKLEETYGRERLRNLLQTLKERGYDEGITVNSILELDRIVS